MQTWSPLWRWVALGVLAALTLAWVAQTEARGWGGPFAGHGRAAAQTVAAHPTACGPGGTAVIVRGEDDDAAQQVCVNMPGATVVIDGNGSGAATSASPRSIAALREQAELQRQEARLQAQQAQLQAQIAALQARLGALGQ